MISDIKIKELFSFVAKKRVRYKDVQIELVDHLATAIEEIMEHEPNLTFNKALEKVYAGFGIYGFAKIIEQKEQAMHKFWRTRIFNYVRKFYALPRIIGTIGSMILVFLLLYYGFIGLKPIVIIVTLCAFCGIVWVMYVQHVLDNTIRDYLYVKSYYNVVGSFIFAFFYVPNIYFPNMDSNIWNNNYWTILIISFCFPMGIILSYICLYEIPKELKKEFELRFKRYIQT